MTIELYERVSGRVSASGLSVTAEGVAEIDKLLGEERFAMKRRGSAKEVQASHAASVTHQEARDHVG
ncbi:MAG TPA: hypothetical protein VFJ46_17650 [Xanthobacteraceae bacterium]|nr:hypothetical protein [Xanthobacteraceae bacterium]